MAKAKAQDEKPDEKPVEKQTEQDKQDTAAESFAPEFEDRIDEHGIAQFQALGYKGRLPDNMVALYKAFKMTKDKILPGRLSAEGIAFVVTMSDIISNKLVLPEA